MKTCPICKARCFDDMEICYGCMHRFEKDAVSQHAPVEDKIEPEELPLRPGVGCGETSSVSGGESGRQQSPPKPKSPRKEMPRVFGATGSDEYTSADTDAYSGAPMQKRAMVGFEGVTEGVPRFEPMLGPLAVAALGNGYRLVVSVERE